MQRGLLTLFMLGDGLLVAVESESLRDFKRGEGIGKGYILCSVCFCVPGTDSCLVHI